MERREDPILEACVGRTRWRLWRNEFLRRLARGIAVAAVLLLLCLVARAWGVSPGLATWILPVAALGVGLAYATEASVSEEEAAIFLDRRAGGGDIISSAVSAGEGPFAGFLREEASTRCRDGDAPGLARYRPSLAARATPIILVLCIAVEVAAGGIGPERVSGEVTPPGGDAGTVGARVRGLIAEIEEDPGSVANLPERLRAAHLEVEEARAIYREVLEEVTAETALQQAIEGGPGGLADLEPGAIESGERTLEEAIERLPEGGEARAAAAAARNALEIRSDEEVRGALSALIDLLRQEAGEGLAEASAEIRRLGSQQGIHLLAYGGKEAPPEAEPLPVDGATGEELERAMDREEVPGEYRGTVRRYFERRGEVGR